MIVYTPGEYTLPLVETMDEKPHKRNSVRLAIRKVTYAPDVPGPQPTAEAQKDFVVSPGALHLEATLDKEVRKLYHSHNFIMISRHEMRPQIIGFPRF